MGNYVSPNIAERFRRQSFKVWTVALATVFLWNFLILLAPLAQIGDSTTISATLYKFFSVLCHQQVGRSFHLDEYPLAVCARCFGVYFGLLAGFVGYPSFRQIENVEAPPRFWLFAAMVPIGIDWALGVFGIWENTHLSRFVTGLILGFACAVFIVPSLVELFRLIFTRRRKL